jgi:hypothetical protein
VGALLVELLGITGAVRILHQATFRSC